ncbi:hypothetical protein JRG42_22055 [Pseudomonas granadensis]|uniref:hypothetical protein n=1 Tax=Pseudomonas granadensis TaxID=1421430 RepID=UPI0019D210B1|nr:hypothetical protein [Pseudomonas granadensis]MBN6776012.1 hypothetical protein [Pseudomonas granadensis]MBN6807656.1 hypothetical protein [Pseudomonas granadensis]MBN6833856.1 hypothetical protein [Pseudomonas granadensis]MBN6841369.1 hypothetical protein [Pseudomonas granadensis]MBN6870044.1 hypothetical protein [Pseudomonas granadensis]
MSETDLEMELKAWRLLLEDDAYRLDFPEDYHHTLIQRADELLLHEWITRDDWQLLKNAADQAREFTLESLAREQRDCLKTSLLQFPRGHEERQLEQPPHAAATHGSVIMTEEKNDQPDEPKNQPNDTAPAHSTEQERERLKDFNKDGIPPGSC